MDRLLRMALNDPVDHDLQHKILQRGAGTRNRRTSLPDSIRNSPFRWSEDSMGDSSDAGADHPEDEMQRPSPLRPNYAQQGRNAANSSKAHDELLGDPPDALLLHHNARMRDLQRAGASSPDGAARAREAPKAVRELPPPLPLHDFSKDKPSLHMPKTGFRTLLPAPRHYFAACARNESMDEVNSERMQALIQHTKASFSGRGKGQIVYSAATKPVDHLNLLQLDASGQVIGMNEPPKCDPASLSVPVYTLTGEHDETLIFESRFESGNLMQAAKVGEHEYDLLLRTDVNTAGHTQWFYFSVRNMRKDRRYQFNIRNFSKKDSLYAKGLRPLMFSETRAKTLLQGWHRCGDNICYFANPRKGSSDHHHTLSFTVEFQYEKDCVYFAHCYPYTYRDLQEYLDQLEADQLRRKHFRRRVLCKTIAKNNLDVLTITSSAGIGEQKNKPVVLISARVHPGETNASWMMKGIIDFLTSEDEKARFLRDRLVFRLVPMLNPDGVINGNYRCNLAGRDLNRRWRNPSRELHPTIHHYKDMILQLAGERHVLMQIDLHGHSQKKNVFIYGCGAKYWRDPDTPAPTAFMEQVYPWLLSQRCDLFSFKNCRFNVQRCKESCGRVVCWREIGIVNSYTLEASFGGPDSGNSRNKHFSIYDLEDMGKAVCLAIYDYETARMNSCVHDEILLEITQLRDHGEQVVDDDGEGADSSSGDEIDATGTVHRRKSYKKKKEKKAEKPVELPPKEPLIPSDEEVLDLHKARREKPQDFIDRLARPKRKEEKRPPAPEGSVRRPPHASSPSPGCEGPKVPPARNGLEWLGPLLDRRRRTSTQVDSADAGGDDIRDYSSEADTDPPSYLHGVHRPVAERAPSSHNNVMPRLSNTIHYLC